MKKLFIAFLSLFSVAACTKDYAEADRAEINKWLTDNNSAANAVFTPEGICFVSTLAGTGGNPTIDNTVTVHYEGFLMDGSKFDSSRDRGAPATFGLTQVIKGWQIGIPLFKRGERGQLLIPSSYAYGNNPPAGSSIPKRAVLRFDIELISIQ
jgi:FKBP-type peptidyl-prolyl cis-trans isomerase